MDIITDSETLKALCKDLAQDDFVTVDTEFMREQTYWPVLCLVQIAGEKQEAIIDPLAPGLDLSPLYELMANEGVVKVFHAARQDIEIFHHRAGVIPHPLFDTQVAAMVCGFGDQVGYEALVRKLARAEIDKSSRFTDWSRRPLSRKQVAYALSDVTHLRVIYAKLKAELNRSGREPWLEEEMAILTSPATYAGEPDDAWRRIRFRPRNRRQIAVLAAVAAWREREAQARNVPRSRILKDDALGELAIQSPTDRASLELLRAVPKGYANARMGEEILAAVRHGLEADLKNLPDIERERAVNGDGTGAIADVLKLALKVVSEREGIAAKLIASSSDIDRIAAGQRRGIDALTGWRRRVFGDLALELMAGRLAIGLRDGKADIFPAEPPEMHMRAAE